MYLQRPSLPTDRAALERDPALALEIAWRDAEALLGLVICVHDLTGAFRAPGGDSLLADDRTIHAHPYCRRLHDRRCIDHCLHDMNRQASRRTAPLVHRCWKGVVEVAVPVQRDGVHLATIFAGTFRDGRGRNAPQGPDFPADLLRDYQQLAVAKPTSLQQAGRFLATYARGLVERLEEWRHTQEADAGDRTARIHRFIRHRAHEQLRLEDLAAHLGISASRASHVVRNCCGCAFNQLLQRERLERGRSLLATSSRSVAEIAELVGYASAQHFSRAFRSAYGEAPGRWRRQPRPR
ncbi:MAG: helix-turn-helix domain-containing protein [Planctomycetota bacterium]